MICAGVILSVMGAAFFFYVLCAPHPWPVCLVCAGTDWLVPKSPVAFHTLGLGLLPVCISISPMPTSLCLTGIVLAMHYTPHVVCAGVSIEHILREVYGGWLLRHAHANGASLFFLAVYLHLFRGLALGHAWRVFVWCVGVLLLLLSVLTAFVGYVLPWGQMCFWGATVITSLASAFPVVGNPLVTWLWGGLSVENAICDQPDACHHFGHHVLRVSSSFRCFRCCPSGRGATMPHSTSNQPGRGRRCFPFELLCVCGAWPASRWLGRVQSSTKLSKAPALAAIPA